ncbi:unnamed protein product [Ambrosiozyma monospora]|uniref:Unnamed protein product n=1 Tax=Ambrosiozyma monospora TaxID=43982 RepID=A0A9W6Z599_AMBMO|nr:unnamed protein product [Ambrosiozyma monospora]
MSAITQTPTRPDNIVIPPTSQSQSQNHVENSELQQNTNSGLYSLLPNDPHVIQDRLRAFGEQVVQEIYLDDDNAEQVEHFNYKQELQKKFSVSSIIGLGFSLMNVPFGMATTLSIGLVCGSSFTILWGWVMFSIFTLFVALSLSEISSKFPSSGGVYHFSSILANEKYALVSSWFTGWYLIIGNLLMFVSCAFGGSQFILSIFGLKESDYKHDDWLVLSLFAGISIFCVSTISSMC